MRSLKYIASELDPSVFVVTDDIQPHDPQRLHDLEHQKLRRG